MDIVYLVKNCYTNEELTYSLRSLVNLPHDRVIIVGGCPANINKHTLVHFPIFQGGNKYSNTTANLKTICQNKELSEDFILMNDDFFILKPVTVEDLKVCRGPIDKVLESYVYRYGTDANPYISGMRKTKIFLQDLGIKEPISYELHIPMVINKKKFLDMFSLPHIEGVKPLHKRTLYGNLYCKGFKEINDVKVLNEYYYPFGSDKFLSTEDNSWPRVKPFMQNLFPNKSEFEI